MIPNVNSFLNDCINKQKSKAHSDENIYFVIFFLVIDNKVGDLQEKIKDIDKLMDSLKNQLKPARSITLDDQKKQTKKYKKGF